MFTEKIKDYIVSHSLINENDRVIVGLSGGADSVALLSVLREIGVDCVAAHCNFHLRGNESNRDEAFCRELTEKLGVPIITCDFDVASQQQLSGESVEMACRSLRYDWWESLLAEGKGDLIAVGHHREDNIETFFLNLLRGSGLRGLKAILPVNGKIVRPLLDVTRKEIEQYLEERGLEFVTDSTNRDSIFKRNRLRLKILPLIEEEFPGASEAISRSISHLQGNTLLYDDYIRLLREKYTDEDDRIDVARVVDESPAPETAVLELIRPFGLNSTHAHDITESVRRSTSGGKRFGGCLLDRGYLYPPSTIAEVVDSLEISFISADMFREMLKAKATDSNTLYLDAEAVDPESLTVRGWRDGDRMAPFGMKGTKLVSDILSDAKLTANQKREVRIVEKDGKILWVAGLRASRHYPVTWTTRQVAVIRLKRKPRHGQE